MFGENLDYSNTITKPTEEYIGDKMTENKLLLTGEELAIAVNAGVDKAVEWSRSNPNTPDTTYLAMREKCIIESVSQSQLSKILNAGYVRLSPDQTLPQSSLTEWASNTCKAYAKSMLKASWRKVEV